MKLTDSFFMTLKSLLALTILSFSLHAADTKHIEMDYGDTLFMSLDTDTPEPEHVVRKALVQKLATKALPEKGTPIGKGRVIKVKDAIEDTELDPIYQYQRERSTGYLIAVPAGEYKVTLQFAEIKRKSHGERVFDIYLQQKLIQEDFDPLKVTGAQFKAIDIEVEKVQVDKFLRLEFTQKSTRSTPAIAGIVIEGANFSKKINCGGEAALDYEADWDKYDYMEDPFSTGIIFDTELLRYSAAWINGFVSLKGTAFDATHGTHPAIQGDQTWGSGYLPGWVPDGKSFSDPRAEHLGHLPKDWAHYKGLYRHDKGNIIHYHVSNSSVYDKMELVKVSATTVGQAYARTIQTEALPNQHDLLICEVEDENLSFTKSNSTFHSSTGLYIDFKGLSVSELKLKKRKLGEVELTAIYATIPKGAQHFNVAIFRSEAEDALTAFQSAYQNYQLPNLKDYTQGGQTRWPGTLTTQGTQGENKGSFTIDEIVMPENNPWRSWMRPGAFDFSADGKSMYVSTWSGDVWKVSNLDNLNELVWKRFAAGLFHPLGLKVVEGRVYVQCRDQIAILDDLNGDGEADHYVNFNNDVVITENFHEFSFELHRDAQGNFYFIKGAPVVAGGEGFGNMKVHHGKLFKVSPDGSKLEVIASGFRAPNGLGISPDGQLSSSDNEGNWVAATPINWIEQDGFYGVQPTYAGDSIPEKRSPIICWIPHKVDNSAGGQVWVPEGQWGEYGGEMFHISYGQAKLFHVLKEKVDGQIQGGVVDLKPTGSFEAGIMRGRFNQKDSAIYLCGLKGWQTKGIKDGGIYRVRYTGQTQTRPVDLKVGSNGIKITFNQALKADSALDAGNFNLNQWVYEISDKYGSKHYKVPKGRTWDLKSDWSPLPQDELDKFNQLSFKDEEAKKAAKAQLYDKYVGEDQVTISSLSLSDDGKTLFIEIPEIAPVMQMKIAFEIEDLQGQKVKHDIYQTIHQLGSWKGTPGKKILASDLDKAKPGLIATYTHRGQNKVDHRVERMTAFHIAERDPITQFLDHGPFNAQFNGFIKVDRNMKVDFFTTGKGTGTMSINGALVFRESSFDPQHAYEVQLKKGFNKLNLNYFGPDKGAASFRLYWEALEYFPKEPLPAKVLFHESDHAELTRSNLKRQGLEVAVAKNCFQCHDAGEQVQLPELQNNKISLNNLGTRMNAHWVSEWIKNPNNFRAHANMPNMLKNLPESEWSQAAIDLASYLTTDPKESQLQNADASEGEQIFGKLGCASCHNFEAADEQPDLISLKYVGFKFKEGQIASFLQQPNLHNPAIKMPNFELSETEASSLEHYLRSTTNSRKAEKLNGNLARGAQYFEKLNCAACHDYKDSKPKTFGNIFGKSGGCLSDYGNGKPKYEFTQSERESLKIFLAEGQSALEHREPIEFAARSLKANRCLSCHTQDGKASNWSSPHRLPSELPPSLSHVGEKLHGPFLSKIFKGELNGKMRPWMKAKMPLFEKDADLLARGLNASHGFSDEPGTPYEGAEQDTGGGLILQNGFACIVCHAAGSTQALAPFGAPGPNLSLAGERLRHEYYMRWMLNPQRAEPTTHMTKFSADHKTTAVQAFEGDAKQQFNAIWDYIQTLK